MTDQPDYTATLPAEFDGKGLKIDEKDPRYVAAKEFARKNNFTQETFTALLGVEARGVVARQAAAAPAAPAPAPTPAASPPAVPTKPYSQMSFAEKLALGEARKSGGR